LWPYFNLILFFNYKRKTIHIALFEYKFQILHLMNEFLEPFGDTRTPDTLILFIDR